MDVAALNRARPTTDDSVLVVVDMQERLLPAIDENARVTANCVRLAQFAQLVGLPVVLAQQEKLGPVIAEVAALLPDAPVFLKRCFDCLSCEELAEHIRTTRRRNLLLCGIEAHVCVAQTALHAVESAYRVHVVADATSSRDLRNRDVSIERMRFGGAVITNTEMLIYELLVESGTEVFRTALDIVKSEEGQ